MRTRWQHGLNGLIDKRGRDAKVIDWLDELTVDCKKKQARKMTDPCGAQVPGIGEGAVAQLLSCPNQMLQPGLPNNSLRFCFASIMT